MALSAWRNGGSLAEFDSWCTEVSSHGTYRTLCDSSFTFTARIYGTSALAASQLGFPLLVRGTTIMRAAKQQELMLAYVLSSKT